MLEMNVAPGFNVDDVHVPRGVVWKRPASPVVVQPSPAPMSEDTTATWMFGSPPGSAWSALVKLGKSLTRFACEICIEAELSITNRTSTLRFAISARDSVAGEAAGAQLAKVSKTSAVLEVVANRSMGPREN